MVFSINEQDFAQTVLQSDQPILVNFWAPWCGLCHLIHPFLVKLQREWDGQIGLVDVNADHNLRLANAYQIKRLPTILLFYRGQLVERVEEFQERDRLTSQLENLIESIVRQSA